MTEESKEARLGLESATGSWKDEYDFPESIYPHGVVDDLTMSIDAQSYHYDHAKNVTFSIKPQSKTVRTVEGLLGRVPRGLLKPFNVEFDKEVATALAKYEALQKKRLADYNERGVIPEFPPYGNEPIQDSVTVLFHNIDSICMGNIRYSLLTDYPGLAIDSVHITINTDGNGRKNYAIDNIALTETLKKIPLSGDPQKMRYTSATQLSISDFHMSGFDIDDKEFERDFLHRSGGSSTAAATSSAAGAAGAVGAAGAAGGHDDAPKTVLPNYALLELDVINQTGEPMTVWSRDLKPLPPRPKTEPVEVLVRPARGDIPIATLPPRGRLKLKANVIKGTGKYDARYSPVTCLGVTQRVAVRLTTDESVVKDLGIRTLSGTGGIARTKVKPELEEWELKQPAETKAIAEAKRRAHVDVEIESGGLVIGPGAQKLKNLCPKRVFDVRQVKRSQITCDIESLGLPKDDDPSDPVDVAYVKFPDDCNSCLNCLIPMTDAKRPFEKPQIRHTEVEHAWTVVSRTDKPAILYVMEAIQRWKAQLAKSAELHRRKAALGGLRGGLASPP